MESLDFENATLSSFFLLVFSQSLSQPEEVQKHNVRIKDYLKQIIGASNFLLSGLNTEDRTLIARLPQFYRNIGLLFKHGANHIYQHGKEDCLFVSLLNSLLISHNNINFLKQHKQCFYATVGASLNLFIDGIASLRLSYDMYLQARLRDLVLMYVPHFLEDTISNKLFTHPIIVSLLHRQSNGFLQTFLKIFQSCFFEDHQTLNFTKPLHFLHVLCQRLSDADLKATADEMLVPVVNAFLRMDSKQTEKSLDLMQFLVDYYVESGEGRCYLIESLKKVGLRSFRTSGLRFYRFLEVLYPRNESLMRDLIPGLMQCIHEYEEAKGVGEDTNLRLLHQSFVKKVGIFAQSDHQDKKIRK